MEGHPIPRQTKNSKPHSLHSLFPPFAKRTVSFRIAWILAHRFSVSVSHHNYKSIGNKKLFIWNLTVLHSFNGGWHSRRAGILEATCLLYSATAIQRQSSGPHSTLWSWKQQHRLPIWKAWKLPWAVSDVPYTNYKLLFKHMSLVGQWLHHHQGISITYVYNLQRGSYGQFCSCKRINTELPPSSAKLPVPLQLTGCTEKADCVRRRISKTDLCRQAPPEYIPSRHRRQLVQSMWITETNHTGMPERCRDRRVKRKAKWHSGISTWFFLNLLLQNFSWGSTRSFLENSLPLISLSGLTCNCQLCNLLVLGQLARFSLSFEMSYFSISGVSRVYTIYLWPTFLPVIKPSKIYPDIIQKDTECKRK